MQTSDGLALMLCPLGDYIFVPLLPCNWVFYDFCSVQLGSLRMLEGTECLLSRPLLILCIYHSHIE